MTDNSHPPGEPINTEKGEMLEFYECLTLPSSRRAKGAGGHFFFSPGEHGGGVEPTVFETRKNKKRFQNRKVDEESFESPRTGVLGHGEPTYGA